MMIGPKTLLDAWKWARGWQKRCQVWGGTSEGAESAESRKRAERRNRRWEKGGGGEEGRGGDGRDGGAGVVGKGKGDKRPGDGRPDGLVELTPSEVGRLLAALVLSDALDGPAALLLGQEAGEGRTVVDPPVDEGRGQDRQEADDQEQDLVDVEARILGDVRAAEGEERAEDAVGFAKRR